MLRAIKKFLKQKEENKKRQQLEKFYEVRGEWIKFFEERDKHYGNVNLPPFMQADAQMKIIMANGELDMYYKKVRSYKKRYAIV